MMRTIAKCPILTDIIHVAPGVWTRLPNGITVMQPDTDRELAVCAIASDGTGTLSSGATWHIRA